MYSLKVDQTVSVVGEVFGVINNAVSVGQGQIVRWESLRTVVIAVQQCHPALTRTYRTR